MKTTTHQQHIESKLNNGETLKSVYKYLLKNLDSSGCSRLKYPDHGFELFYTSNPNYANGIKNGYGPGMYASLKFCGYHKTVKIQL